MLFLLFARVGPPRDLRLLDIVILRDLVFGGNIHGETVSMLTKQLGVKTSEILNILEANPILQAVEGCGFSATSNNAWSERQIDTVQVKVNDEWCVEDLLGKFAEYKVRIGANEGEMPFEAEFISEYIKGVQKQIEKAVWQGDSGLNMNGFVTIAEGTDSGSTVTGEVASGSTAYELIKKAWMMAPEEIIDDLVIFVSPAVFREYIQDLVTANLYHYNPNDGDLEEFFLPGTNVRVKKAYGLAGLRVAYASTLNNMFYGCDFLDNKEEVKVWYSDDNDVYRCKIRFNFGVQTAFPDMVVLIKEAEGE